MSTKLLRLSILSRRLSKLIKHTYFLKSIVFSDCKCNPDGSTTMECGKINGDCSCKEGYAGIKCDKCKPNVNGDKCDACQPSFFGYPSCQGLSKSIIFDLSNDFYFSDCKCNPNGSTSLACDTSGKCTCKVGFSGMKCDPDGTKVLVATGLSSGRNTEIIDLEDASFKCTISHFPTSTDTPTGGLVGNTAIICGGKIGLAYQKSCYSLKEDGAWKLEESSDLSTARRSAATGTVIMNSKLVMAGGSNGTNLASIEVVAPNTKSVTLPISLPVAMHAPCIVPWDTNTFMVIGGYGASQRSQTHFINISNNSYTDGPNLLIARHWTACHTFIINGEDYIIVAGGSGAEKSTEVLSKANYGTTGWEKSKN